MISEVIKWGEFVKLSHTVFALPFALASMTVAARETRGWPGWRLFLLIVGAVLTARTCAMSFNRIVDRHFDKENPRTAERHPRPWQSRRAAIIPLSRASEPRSWHSELFLSAQGRLL